MVAAASATVVETVVVAVDALSCTAVFAVGVGPLTRSDSRARVGEVLRKVDLVTVRDDESAALLVECGVPGETVHVGADLVWALEPSPGEPLYACAYDTGRALAVAGHTVLTGGYGGVMEAASRGALEAGGRTVGVTCSIFGARTANAWIHKSTDTRLDRQGVFPTRLGIE